MDAATDWRISLQPDNRQNLVSMIMETLKNCFPDSGPEGFIKLNQMAEWYEEESYTEAKNKFHYLRKISLKIQNIETIFQTTGKSGMPKCFWDIMDAATDRRISLQPDNRQNLVNMIMEILKNCFPDSGPERLAKLNKMAEWYEEESYIAATNMSDYLRRISLKILNMEKIFQTTGMLNTIQSKSAGSTQIPLATASHGMQSQVRNQKKSQILLPNQSQARQHIKPQNIENTTVNARVQSSASLPSAAYVTSLSQTSLSKAVNTQSGIAQNSVGSSVRQGIPSNVFSNLQYLYHQLRHQIVSSSIDSEAQTPHAGMYLKYRSMKEMHLPCLIDVYQKICIKCQQFDSRPNVSDSEAVERIKLYKNTLERSMLMLNVSKNNIVFAEKIGSCEEELISFLSSNRPQKPISAQQHIRKHGDHPLSMQPQQQHQQQQQQLKPDNQMNHQMQPTNMQNSVSSKQSTAVTSTRHESINSNAQTILNAVDQQEEIYKKIQFMKEKYLPGLNDMYQNISIECEHDDSLLNVPNSERIERLKLTKNMLELAIRILNLSKSSIVPAVEFISYRKVGQNIIRSNRPQIPVSAQQQVRQPGGHLFSMQPQQQQHPDNPMQPTNMQKSVSSKQSTAVTSTCHASTDSEAQKGQNAFDWQEETYQKIQSMKKKYLPSLNDMYQQITINCQQSKESGKMIKALETAMKILNVSKDNIVPAQKEKLAIYEKVILLVLSKGPRKPVSEQQQQQPPEQQQQEAQQQPQQQEAQQQEAQQQQQQQEAQQQ